MQNANYFFLIFLITIVAARVMLLSAKHQPGTTVHGFRIHHYMYGLVLVGIAILLSNLTIYAAGLGLIVDELPMITLNKKFHNWHGYYLKKIMFGVVLLIILVFFFRYQIISLI